MLSYNKHMNFIYTFKDDQFPFTGITRTRISARGLVLNEQNEIGLTHLLCQDKFGHRNYYELPGGGKKNNETPLDAAIREMHEELGVKVELIERIGVIHDYYNLINQENYTFYYLFKAISFGTPHLEVRESRLIDKIEWLPLDTAIKNYQQQLNVPGVGLLVTRRELPILRWVAKSFDKQTKVK